MRRIDAAIRAAQRRLAARINERCDAENRAAAERLKTVHRSLGQLFKKRSQA